MALLGIAVLVRIRRIGNVSFFAHEDLLKKGIDSMPVNQGCRVTMSSG
jgi:hypothetical protein